MIKVQLERGTIWWINFLRSLDKDHDNNVGFYIHDGVVSYSDVQEALTLFKGKYEFKRGKEYIEFDTEHDYIVFLLKWS